MPISRAAAQATLRLGAVALAGALLAACGSGSSGSSESSTGGGEITLTVDLFGTFGFKEAGLYAEYEKLHPNITIKESSTENEADYWKALQTRLAGGGGLADVQGIEVGRIASVTQQQADKFQDLNSFGAASLKNDYSAAKWAAAATTDGRTLGLGTDVGPEAICYRTDLFRKAGLATDRDTLAEKWATWDGYLELGKQYQAKADSRSHWMDSVGSLYSLMMGQQEERYYDASGKLVYQDNPAVRSAWDTSVKAAQEGLSAKLAQWTPAWNQAFSSGSFATIGCPAWMLGYIKGQAGDGGAGTWDVAPLPGRVAGNWGGSYLAVPKGSAHAKEAYELIKWLTAAPQQAKLFEKQGSFPSNLGAIKEVEGVKDAYFSNAPIGEIFGKAAESSPVQVLGVHDNDVNTQITNALGEVERKGASSATAWGHAEKGVRNAVG
ncbi:MULTISPECIES: extracellular solute-binding protein [unclassified Streptomyces]|uniref:extracellular solute-binding protein n=1 Tax=unclassified Streptomyces TaxID=2593676 RepID=UPI001F037756|nr:MULTISPECIES: extracellular solute-binding protein [unclassified Streptomyces]MCH0561713.1 extracellular solute-binding protein [Streptomyces sp. MUM 2J]MCH0568999.1 extracellular solute-binding protein [Streptomyces sp. MUM 136J]